MLPLLSALAAAGPLTFTTVDDQTIHLPDEKGTPYVVEMVRSLDW